MAQPAAGRTYEKGSSLLQGGLMTKSPLLQGGLIGKGLACCSDS